MKIEYISSIFSWNLYYGKIIELENLFYLDTNYGGY